MKIGGVVFGISTVFFAMLSIIYWVVSNEPVGTVGFAFASGLSFLISFYVLYTGLRAGPGPEDRQDAEIEEGTGEVAFFSPRSWWPLPVAAGATILALGLVFAWWLFAIGALFLIMAVIGLVFEYYRGEPAQ